VHHALDDLAWPHCSKVVIEVIQRWARESPALEFDELSVHFTPSGGTTFFRNIIVRPQC
jgi:hypothetical protein